MNIENDSVLNRYFAFLLLIALILSFGIVCGDETKTVTDMRGKSITLSKDPQRVVIIDRGLIADTMRALGVEDRIVGAGGIRTSFEKVDDFDVTYLNPRIMDLPDLGYPRKSVSVNIESVAFANPDVVIFLQSEYTKNGAPGFAEEAFSRIESMNIPLVVINGPGYYEKPTVEKTHEAIQLIGEIFNKEEEAEEIVQYLINQEDMISERTENIPESEQPSTLFIGIGNETSGLVWGGEYGDAKFTKDIAHIKNVYNKHEQASMSAELVNTLNPDVIILGTYITVPETPDLLEKPEYATFRELKAVKEDRVGALGLLSSYGDYRLDYPTILLIEAKTVYPDKFSDINVYDWLMNHYKTLYDLTDDEAEKLAKIQKIDWMKDKNF